MLVMYKMDVDLRKYLQLTHNRLTWKERIKIIYDIILAIGTIHSENAMHRDLHAGNILYLQLSQKWYISDFGFYGPANKPLNSIYGNLPYIAPEVIAGKEYTFASDIYSIAMLMWEISSGQPPFNNYEHDHDLATKTVTGIRPKVMPGTPLKYKTLMEQCWDADPLKRPDITTLVNSFFDMHHSYYQNIPDDLSQLETNSTATTINSSEFKFEDLNLTSERDDTTELTEGTVIIVVDN
jgi:serine/threonine protein kinase